MRGRLPRPETAEALQLPPGISSRQRPLRRHPGHADGAPLRDPGTLVFRPHSLRRLGLLRRALLHRLHPEPLHDQRRPVLRDHEAPGVRRQADAEEDDCVRVFGLARSGLYQFATTTDTGKQVKDFYFLLSLVRLLVL